MEQLLNFAASMDAQIKSSKEEYTRNMGQRSNDAAVKNAPIKLGMEECARGMEQRSSNGAIKGGACVRHGAKVKRCSS
jgi:hypothetical protein